MALFDGPVVKFAQKFCEYLDGRVKARYEEADKVDDPGQKFMNATIALTLHEVSTALKTIAGL
jgi:hypothetical protein